MFWPNTVLPKATVWSSTMFETPLRAPQPRPPIDHPADCGVISGTRSARASAMPCVEEPRSAMRRITQSSGDPPCVDNLGRRLLAPGRRGRRRLALPSARDGRMKMRSALPARQAPAGRAQPTLVFRQIVAPVQPGHALGGSGKSVARCLHGARVLEVRIHLPPARSLSLR